MPRPARRARPTRRRSACSGTRRSGRPGTRSRRTSSIAHHATIADSARTFAALDVTFADSTIAFYDAKYAYRLWRPITAIRQADRDGNPATVADPAWTPLSNTAPDPSYVGRPRHDQRRRFRRPALGLRQRRRLHRDVVGAPGRHALVHELLPGRGRGERQPHPQRQPHPTRRGRRRGPRTQRRRVRAAPPVPHPGQRQLNPERPGRAAALLVRRPPAGPSPTPRSHHRHEPPRRGPGPDGHVPGLPPHLRDPRRRAAGHDARRRGPPPPNRRPDLARARAALVEGVRDPVRRRRRLRHDHLVRARPAVAALHRRGGPHHRPAVLARGLRVLPRGDLPRHLPLRLGPAVAARAPPRRRAGRDLRDRVGLLHRDRERVDERAARLPPRARRDHPHRPGPRAVQPGVADRDHAHGRRRPARDRVRDRLGLRRRPAPRPPRQLPPQAGSRSA